MNNYSIYKELKKRECVDDAFKSWERYRKNVTNCIINNSVEFDSIAIFGAGRCNDIDLKIIEEKYDQVFLLDINDQSMTEGLKQHGLENSKKIKLEKIDFLGIQDKDYIFYESILKS